MEDILKDLVTPNTVDNRLTDTLKPLDEPFNNLQQAKVDYTLEAGDNPYSVSEKFNVPKSYIEDKMQTSGNKQGDRITEILVVGFQLIFIAYLNLLNNKKLYLEVICTYIHTNLVKIVDLL